ncbi:hypothetical protein IFM47457_06880 [Aspergillus lentulus]|nr:hypothetical protein IFM47457_06880 [Aspergillus lentulus]
MSGLQSFASRCYQIFTGGVDVIEAVWPALQGDIHICLAGPPMATASFVELISARPMVVDQEVGVHTRDNSTCIIWIE